MVLLIIAILGTLALVLPIDGVGSLLSGGALLAGVTLAVVASERRSLNSDRVETLPVPAESDPTLPRRALIVGAGTVGQELARSLDRNGYDVVGFVDDEIDGSTSFASILGRRESTSRIVREYGISEVFLAYAPTWQQQLAEELAGSESSIRVNVVPTPFESLLKTGQVENFGDIAVVRMGAPGSAGYDYVKRGLDLLSSVAGLILTAPLTLGVAIMIRITSPGGAIFAQDRVGRNGTSFLLYKFRTMVQDAEAETGPVLAEGMQDARLTSLGKWLRAFRIDEIPQLWNVVRGEMSLVGPRPERRCFVDQFTEHSPSYSQRHQVRPGITGLAQVRGGYHTHWRDKLRFDLYYISHRSLWLDLSILLKTVLVVILPKGK